MVGFECRNILKHFLELTLNLFSAYASWYVIFHPIRGLRPIWDFDLTIIEYPHRFKDRLHCAANGSRRRKK